MKKCILRKKSTKNRCNEFKNDRFTCWKIRYRNCSEARYSRGYKGYPGPHFYLSTKCDFRSCSDLKD